MEVLERIIPFHRPDKFHLYTLGDIHAGTEHCAEDKIKAQIREINEALNKEYNPQEE